MSDAAVETYRAGLDPATLKAVDALRDIAAGAHPELVESIKWNAPNFALGGEDRITLGVAPKGGVRVVLHRGAKVPDADQFSFDDKAGLAKWPSPGRGVIQFSNAQEIEERREPLADLFGRWLAATA